MKPEIKLATRLAGFLLAVVPASLLHGHGTPIQVDVVDGALVVSGGTPTDQGFASMMYFDDDEDGDPFGAPTLPGLGPVILWQLPGLELFGMDGQSSLSIEVLSRPVLDADPAENRLLWYWDPTSERVEAAIPTDAMYLLGTGMRSAAIAPPNGPAPPPFKLADSVAGQTGFHNHGLLQYALDNSPAAAPGAYGFFARLLSNQYTASDPFLLLFNYGVDFEQMLPAAMAINAAAADGLPGDFNRDGTVDAADYTVWRDGSLGPEKYAEWKTNFGQSVGSGGAANSIATVPEPASLVLTASVLVWGACVFVRPLRRQANLSPHPPTRISRASSSRDHYNAL